MNCELCSLGDICKYREDIEEKLSSVGNEIDSIQEEFPNISIEIKCNRFEKKKLDIRGGFASESTY